MSKKKNKNKDNDNKQEKRIEQESNTYECYVCGKTHNLNEICPVVQQRLKKVKYHANKYDIIASIILECLKRKRSVTMLFAEIDSACNTSQGYCVGEPNNIYTDVMPWLKSRVDAKLKNQSLPVSVFGFFKANTCIMGVGDLDFVISYAATYLDCPSSVFYKSEKQVIDELLDFLFGKENNLLSERIIKRYPIMSRDGGILQNNLDYSAEAEIYRPSKYDNHNCTLLQLTYELAYNNINPDSPELIDIDFSKCLYGYERVEYYITVSSGYENNLIIPGYQWEFSLEDNDEQIKYLFDAEWDRVFDEHDYLPEEEFDSSKTRKWINLLKRDTIRGIIRWNSMDGYNKVSYETRRLDYKISLECDPKKYVLTIKDSVYHGFWTACDIKSNDSRTIKNFENIIKASCAEEYRKHIKAEKGDKPCQLTYADVLVVGNTLWCEKVHNVSTCWGLVPILTENEILSYKVFLGYCEQCDRYYMYQEDYEEMIKTGKPLCDVIADGKLINRRKSEGSFHFKAQSIIHAMGYTVQAKSGLSTEERRDILETAIEKSFTTPNEIVNFLTWLIVTRKPMKQYETAINKWSEDKKYIQEKYTEGEVGIGKITVKK
jgi:hypothetical protein